MQLNEVIASACKTAEKQVIVIVDYKNKVTLSTNNGDFLCSFKDNSLEYYFFRDLMQETAALFPGVEIVTAYKGSPTALYWS